jgi:8-amino-7-oxononanoate synthase
VSEFERWLDVRLGELETRDQRRRLRVVEPVAGMRVRVDGRPAVLFSSNDYLGLSSHPVVVAASRDALESGGLGPRGSALVCGRTAEHAALENELATMVGTPAALVLPSGWAANAGTLAALASADLTVFSDELNHASIVEGCRLAARAGAQVEVYRHANMEHLAGLLAAARTARLLVVTDSVFSMDGDLAPLAELAALRARYGFGLMVDEAHATLLMGERGSGLAEALGVAAAVDVHVGTLSKAVGAQGGFVAGSRALVDWLVNRNRAGVFSTALTLPTVAAARAAIRVAQTDPSLRATLGHYRRLAGPIAPGRTPIVPVVLGAEKRALGVAASLLEAGYFVPAIRPPTVPPGTSRLRVTLSAAHRPDEVEGLLAALGRLM